MQIILFDFDIISCSESGTTEPPTPVDANSINIFNPSLTDVEQSLYQISMRVMWDPPLEPYGAKDYEIHVDNETANVNNQSIFIPTVVSIVIGTTMYFKLWLVTMYFKVFMTCYSTCI